MNGWMNEWMDERIERMKGLAEGWDCGSDDEVVVLLN